MGFSGVRNRDLRTRGSSTTGTLVTLACVSVLGVTSLSRFGDALGENVGGKVNARMAASLDLTTADSGPSPLQLGSTASAANIDPNITNRLIDYLAGVGPRPGEIAAGSKADKMLNEVLATISVLVGNNESLRDDLRANLRANHGDVEKILFTGINDISEVNPDLVNIVLGSGGNLLEKLGTLTNLALNLEKNHAEGRSELQKILKGQAPESSEGKTTSDAVDEPKTVEPEVEEPKAEDPSPKAKKGVSLVEGNLPPEEAGKAIIAAIKANPEADKAVGILQADDDFKKLLTGAISGKVDATTVINVLRKDAALPLLQALANDKETLRMLLGPYANIVTENPSAIRRIHEYLKTASPDERRLLVELIEKIRKGQLDSMDAKDALRYAPLLTNPRAIAILEDLADSKSVTKLLEKYAGGYSSILSENPEALGKFGTYLESLPANERRLLDDLIKQLGEEGIESLDAKTALKYVPLLGNPALADTLADLAGSKTIRALAKEHFGSVADLLTPDVMRKVSDFVRTASPEELALLENIADHGFGFDSWALLANPHIASALESLWSTPEGREAVIGQLPSWARPVAGLLGDSFPAFSEAVGRVRKGELFGVIGEMIDGWLDDRSGTQCSGWNFGCRASQVGGLVTNGLKRAAGWIGRQLGGDDNEGADLIVPSTGFGPLRRTTSFSNENGSQASETTPSAFPNAPSPFGAALVRRQMARLAQRAAQNDD